MLRGSLLEILNTEIFLGFIESIEDAMSWIKTTFWFHNSPSPEHMTQLANKSVQEALAALVRMDCVKWSECGVTASSTRSGVLMVRSITSLSPLILFKQCRRYIRSTTMQAFIDMDECGDFDEVKYLSSRYG